VKADGRRGSIELNEVRSAQNESETRKSDFRALDDGTRAAARHQLTEDVLILGAGGKMGPDARANGATSSRTMPGVARSARRVIAVFAIQQRTARRTTRRSWCGDFAVPNLADPLTYRFTSRNRRTLSGWVWTKVRIGRAIRWEHGAHKRGPACGLLWVPIIVRTHVLCVFSSGKRFMAVRRWKFGGFNRK